MRKAKVITALSLAVLMLVSLSNTVSAADGPVGPPIGLQNVEFSPSGTLLPGQVVTVNITWWITDSDATYQAYKGPFYLKIGLKNITSGTEVDDWKIHEPINFSYNETPSNPYYHEFTKYAPSELGTYTLEVQITATGLDREVGNSGKSRYLLLASAEEPITTVPEFSTIAIPVAAILGLLFFFNHRKRKKS